MELNFGAHYCLHRCQSQDTDDLLAILEAIPHIWIKNLVTYMYTVAYGT